MIQFPPHRGCSSMAERQLPKLHTRVRFPSPAPEEKRRRCPIRWKAHWSSRSPRGRAANCPAARVYTESAQAASRHADELRIAFDGDAVLFSDEAERVYQRDGLDAFTKHEITNALQPLPPGPFKPLLEALHRLQAAAGTDVPVRVRTALVTARGAPAHERAIRTLMEWNVAVDELMFLGGLDKGAFLKAFEPDFYFDDQRGHVDSARAHVAAGHVPFGVANLR